jgi:SNF2 family DNA or RNA helicase
MGKAPLIPHPYQSEAIDFIAGQPSTAIFGDCGIGKTIITLSAVSRMLTDFDIKGVLIVAPLRVARMTWPLEIEEWPEFDWMEYALLHGPQKAKRLRESKAPIFLINYEGLIWLAGELKRVNHKDWPFDMVVWDELTKMKSHTSSRFKKWKKFLRFFKYKVGLTGTPMSNGYLDLWAQFYSLDGGEALGTTFTGYRNRFFEQADYMGFTFKPRHGSEDLIKKLIEPMTMRISAADNLDVPPLTFEDVEVKLPTEAKKAYKILEKELFVELDKGEEVEAVNAAVLSNKCLQFAGGSVYIQEENGNRFVKHIHDVKIDAIKKIRKQVKTPLLVAYSFKHERDRLLEAFPEAEVLKSGYSQAEELDILKRWNDGKISMLICHPASAGHGLNLQGGCCVGVWFSLNWSLELYQQFNARLHRQGQKHPVTFYRLLAVDTIDEAVATSLERKDDSQAGLLKALNKYRQK